jgi:hypothetical protein
MEGRRFNKIQRKEYLLLDNINFSAHFCYDRAVQQEYIGNSLNILCHFRIIEPKCIPSECIPDILDFKCEFLQEFHNNRRAYSSTLLINVIIKTMSATKDELIYKIKCDKINA